VVAIFEGRDVMPIVRIEVEDVDKLVDVFRVGSKVKVECRLGFNLTTHILSLTCEKIEPMSIVKVVID
jgi:hypothetical protein